MQLNQQFYEPGDTLIGMIYIKVDEAFKCTKVLLDVESEEKAEFTRFWTEWKGEGEHREPVHRSERHDEEREGFEFKSKLLDLGQYGDEFQPGNYCIQFQFVLPEPLPSSIKYKDHSDKAKPEAKVEHDIKIKLKGTDLEDSPDFKIEFKVRNDKNRKTGNLEESATHEISKYFCIPGGTLESKTAFEKDFFYKNETAKCKVEADMSGTEIDLKTINYNIIQTIELAIDGHKFKKSKVIASKQYDGCSAGDKAERDAEVDLSSLGKELIPSCNVNMIKNYHT